MVFGVAGDLVVTTFHGHQVCLLSRALPSGTVTVFSLLWFRGCHHGTCLIDRGKKPDFLVLLRKHWSPGGNFVSLLLQLPTPMYQR